MTTLSRIESCAAFITGGNPMLKPVFKLSDTPGAPKRKNS